MNKLFYGDNLTIMQHELGKHSVDLIYLDPPFNSKRNYNLMYKNMTGFPVPEQVEAFCDTWELDPIKEERARMMPVLMREYGIDDYYVKFWQLWMQALRNTQPHLLAYLIYMVERLLHMKVLLRPTGSIYLHCDPTASHYIKVMMDGIFGHKNFRNEIVWCYKSRPQPKHNFAKKHDTILFYTLGDKYTFNWEAVARPLLDSTIKKYKNVDEQGRRYRLQGRGITGSPIRSQKDVPVKWEQEHPELVVRDYLDDKIGVSLEDWWTDIDILNQAATERLGYPTQKPPALLDRIIKASSNKGDVVFDPFCGCGTTIYAAHLNERQWIGCDIAILSVKLIKHTLEERYRLVEDTDFEIKGIPTSMEGAQVLFDKDPFQFQHWIVERIGGFPMQKKTADRGIDGRLYFETKDGLKEMVLSVKGGNVRPTDVRDLRGVLEREQGAELAGFLSLHEPTKAMRSEAAEAGCYEYEGVKYDRIQFLTVHQILEEKRMFNTPSRVGVRGATGQLNLAV